MYEFHGWATLRDSPGCDDARQDPERATIEAIGRLAAQFAGDSRTIDLRCANGEWHIWLAGLHNHRQAIVERLFEQVAELAPGSYGLLHVFDDEDPECPNTWRCHVMIRGAVRVENDRYLSPHIGVVEDDCEDGA